MICKLIDICEVIQQVLSCVRHTLSFYWSENLGIFYILVNWGCYHKKVTYQCFFCIDLLYSIISNKAKHFLDIMLHIFTSASHPCCATHVTWDATHVTFYIHEQYWTTYSQKYDNILGMPIRVKKLTQILCSFWVTVFIFPGKVHIWWVKPPRLTWRFGPFFCMCLVMMRSWIKLSQSCCWYHALPAVTMVTPPLIGW